MNGKQASEVLRRIFERGESLAGFYAFLANNPHLSFWNSVQIYTARSGLTVCKSFDDWHDEDNRRIKRGEHGIAYYDENYPGRKRYVFDITQTYGKERYHGVGHRMTAKNLRDCINSQNIFAGVQRGDESEVEVAVYRYCQEHYGYTENEEYDEEYLACLAEGVSHYINVFTGNKPSSVAALPFDEDTNFRICMEVLDISEGLKNAILEEEQRREERKKEQARERAARQSFKIEREVKLEYEQKAPQSKQLSLWEVAQGVSENRVPDAVSDIIDDGQVEETPIVHTEVGRKVGKHSDGTDDEHIDNGLLDEFAEQPIDRADDRRNHTDGSSVPSPRNYRLTDENFEYSTGAKTRFRQNIEAIKLMKQLRQEGRPATEEEKKVLAKYVGWGGLANAFDVTKEEWQKEFTELRELLDADEYRLARESVLSAHYTPKKVIDGMFEGLKRLGFERGKVLEPALGIGNFIGLLPETFDRKETYGVEVDSITGNIAKLLYPETNVKVCGFEQTNFAKNSFDAVITNVPFGSFKVNDAEYNRFGFYIHNFFLAKSIDRVRPGGIVAVITTKGTMDKANPDVRQYIANRANLLGAIRLPNNAFKTSAGTEVTADILFFQKRDRMVENAKDSWINVATDENGVPVNQYFIEHPEMLLGTMVKHKSMYGSDDETELLPDDRDLGQAIRDAIAHLPESVYDEKKAVPTGKEVAEAEIEVGEEYEGLKDYCYVFVGDNLYQREKDKLIASDISRKNIERMKGLVALREQVRTVLNVQLENCTDEELKTQQNELNRRYDEFVKKYGIVNSRLNRSLFRDDADFALLISIENVDEKTGTATKTDVFSKRTIKPYQKVTHCETAIEALQVSKSEKGVVDIRFMEALTGLPYNTIIEELKGKIYRNPDKCLMDEGDKYLGWEDASEYLSGNVREKLLSAESALETNEEYRDNVVALRAVQPAPLQAADIGVNIGASWIDEKYYHQFICELLDVRKYDEEEITVYQNQFTGEWKVNRAYYLHSGVNTRQIYGTSRMDAYEVFEKCLNQQTPTITDEIEEADGRKKRVTNKEQTIAVRERQKKMQEAFRRWIFDDPQRREYLVDKYNEIFNTTVVPQFDGSYLQFPGMNPEITLKPYQKDAVARILMGNNTLLHHSVGAGKTFEIAAACMKLREVGTAQKPIIVVPNHLVVQWANEFRTLYPNANLLMATKKDFEKTSRKRFVAKVATGDWDAVIIAMSSFERVPISKERQEERLNREIEMIERAIIEEKTNENKRITIKDLERTLKNKRTMLEKLTAESKKDNLLKFEDLGVDALFVDEAHKYKNKFIFTRMNNVSGISRAMSQRSTDMDMKCEYINELRGGDKGVVFATGTPISNSLVEMYTLQTYLQRRELEKRGLQFFDSWAADFTETTTALELAPSGQGYRTKTRVAKFKNLPELLKMYRSFADVKTAEMLNLPVPKKDKILVEVAPSDKILELNDEIVQRSERIYKGGVNPSEDNMLCVTHDGKMIALDPRCFDPSMPDDPENKLNICVGNIFEEWENSKADRSTQIVFCDMSTPKKSFTDYDPTKDFDVYNDIKLKLVNLGIPAEEIAFIHDAKTDQQKQDMFDKVRSGEIRILLGSTEKCGAGTNVQDKLIALHHLDTPFRPSDLEQREGRIVRQGNKNPEVRLYTYVTKRTFDAYSYQLLETKQRFISQINNGDLTIREAEDIDDATLSYGQVKAIVSDNPKIMRKMEIEQKLGQLSVLENDHRNNRYRMQDDIIHAPEKIARIVQRIENYKQDIATRDLHKDDLMQIGKKQFEERKDAGDLLIRAVQSGQYIGKTIGYFRGFGIVPLEKEFGTHYLKLVGAGEYKISISDSDVGTIARLENRTNDFEGDLKDAEIGKETVEHEVEIAKVEVNKPFEHQEEVEALQKELAEINAELDLEHGGEPVVLDNEGEDFGKLDIEILDEEDEDEAEAV